MLLINLFIRSSTYVFIDLFLEPPRDCFGSIDETVLLAGRRQLSHRAVHAGLCWCSVPAATSGTCKALPGARARARFRFCWAAPSPRGNRRLCARVRSGARACTPAPSLGRRGAPSPRRRAGTPFGLSQAAVQAATASCSMVRAIANYWHAPAKGVLETLCNTAGKACACRRLAAAWDVSRRRGVLSRAGARSSTGGACRWRSWMRLPPLPPEGARTADDQLPVRDAVTRGGSTS